MNDRNQCLKCILKNAHQKIEQKSGKMEQEIEKDPYYSLPVTSGVILSLVNCIFFVKNKNYNETGWEIA